MYLYQFNWITISIVLQWLWYHYMKYTISQKVTEKRKSFIFPSILIFHQNILSHSRVTLTETVKCSAERF